MALEVFSDMSERLNYNLPGFPLYVRKGDLISFEKHAAACHWHPDLEYILILDGAMDYFINGQTIHLNKGQGIFVNSRRLHYGFSDENSDCSYIVIVIHPSILGENTPVGKDFFESKFGFETADFLLLSSELQWPEKILSSIKRLFDEIQTTKQNPLHILSIVMSLCSNTAENLLSSPERKSNNINVNSWMAVRNMTAYIYQKYEDKITLDDIAAAGSVCRSKCCQLFGEYTGQTPNSYLIGYRIRKSCEMLKESNMSILEVAIACGFQSPSYFTHVFQKEIGQIPREYRNQFKP